MKPLHPEPAETIEAGYPSYGEHAVGASRRTFLRLAGATAAGGLLSAAAPSQARRREARKPEKISIRLKRGYTFRYGNYQLQRCVAQTRSAALARFLRDHREAEGLEAAIRAVLNRHSCADLLDGKRLARLEQILGRALAAHYRKRTRRAVSAPTVVLYVGVPAVACLGSCPAPVPICRPPRP